MAPLSVLLCISSFLLSNHVQATDPTAELNDSLADTGYFPPPDYEPHPVYASSAYSMLSEIIRANADRGIPFLLKDNNAQPWVRFTDPNLNDPLSGPVTHKTLEPTVDDSSCSAPQTGSDKYWYEEIEHNGQSSFLSPEYKNNYNVFRNVVSDFGADNTGQRDASDAIQAAIKAGSTNGPNRADNVMGTTGQPAIVYLPSGTYLMQGPLQIYVGTVIIGDPINPPVLKAAGGFSKDHLIYAKDPNFFGTINFYIGMKNLVIDSTGLPGEQQIGLLDWTVSQATQLTNIDFKMPIGASGHTGLTTQYDYNSNIIMNDLRFTGGSVGMKLAGQQWVFKGLRFTGTTTGVIAGGTDIVFVGCEFEQGATGIDAGGTSGSLTVIDSTGTGLENFIISGNSPNAGNSIILENVQNSGTTVSLDGKQVLIGNVPDTWVHGSLMRRHDPSMEHFEGTTISTERSNVLLSAGKYFTAAPPTYQEYSVDQFVNIKSIPGNRVYGDGETDDTTNINAILAEYAGCKLIYFPAGTYIVTDTIFVPENTRIIGDMYGSVISAAGNKFTDANNPTAMVKVGYPGDTGIAQISDMVFTVADILPGCKLVEVNIAGKSPGDVGFWNSHFRIGGAAGSNVETQCQGAASDCKAAWGLMHLTKTSSAYIENVWGWTADHDLDGEAKQNIATGRGLLVEADKGTWLVGTGFEHQALYQYNFEHAENVFSAMQQSESPYWQGPGNALAPAPWGDSLIESDPDFSNCAPDDALCRMAFFERIHASSNLFLYGGCNWVFFNNNGECKNGKCQTNAIQILDSSNLYLYGTNTKSTINMFLDNNTVIATEDANAGGWGGVLAAYLYNS